MSTAESTTSWGATIVQGIIILVLVVALVFLLYYIFSRPATVPFPVSPFQYNQTVQIRPAVPAQYGTDPSVIPTNQYLTQTVCNDINSPTCPPNGCPSCLRPCDLQCPGSQGGTCTITFTGTKDDPRAKWILRQFDPTGQIDANQALVSGFGNRFFLQNAASDSAADQTARVTFMVFNTPSSSACTYGPDMTMPITGSQANKPTNWVTGFIVYFLPTSQPNLFYLLFPGIGQSGTIPPWFVNSQPNTGVVRLRPWSQPGFPDLNSYCPWSNNCAGTSPNATVNPNGPITSLNTNPSG